MKISQGLETWANSEAERNLLSCILTDNKAIGNILKVIEPLDFYEANYRNLFKTIKTLWDKNKPVDLITVSAEGHDMAEVAEIMSSNITGYKNHVNIVKTLSLKRKGVMAAREIMQGLESNRFDKPQEVTKYIQGKLDLSIPKLEQTPEDTKTIALEVMDYMENVATGKVKPILYGIRDIDYFTGGLWNAEFTIIAAAPGTGKTAFALDVAGNAANNGAKVDFFSLEMNRIQIGSRLFSQTRLVRSESMRNPKNVWENEALELAQASERVAKLPIIIDQTSRTIQEIKNKCERQKELGQLDLVIVDYLQLLTSSAKHDSRRHEVEHISRELKLMSRDLNIPVIALSQLNREGQKVNTKPKLYDLRESGSLEQDADNVIFLYNPKPDEMTQLLDIEIIIAKQRSGRTGKTTLRFDKNYMKFYGLEK